MYSMCLNVNNTPVSLSIHKKIIHSNITRLMGITCPYMQYKQNPDINKISKTIFK